MYLIDGHNLIGRMPDISLSDPHDEAMLVRRLIGFNARTRKKIVVVFDCGIPAGRSHLSTPNVEVVFARPQSSADDLMIGRIQRAANPQQWIVVSGDQRVRAAAAAQGMRAYTSADFAPMLKIAPPVTKDDDPALHPATLDVRLSPREVDEWLREFGTEADAEGGNTPHDTDGVNRGTRGKPGRKRQSRK